jgi:DNA-binding NtrC family response regulator
MTAYDTSAATSPRRSFALITDAEAAIRTLVGRVVTEFDLLPLPVDSVSAALQAIQAHRAELACAVVGSLLPSMHVAAIASAIQQAAPELPLIVMSSLPPLQIPGQPALRIFGFLPKPFAIDDLRAMIRNLLQRAAEREAGSP